MMHTKKNEQRSRPLAKKEAGKHKLAMIRQSSGFKLFSFTCSKQKS